IIDNIVPVAFPEITDLIKNGKISIIIEDPRFFLASASNYDLIIMSVPEPSSATNNRFFTKEFFELCSKSLTKDGIFAFRLPSLENLWLPSTQMRMVAIHNALAINFTDIIVLPTGNTNIIICSNSPLVHSSEIVAKNFRQQGIKTNLVSTNFIKYLYANDRYFEIVRFIEKDKYLTNTDNKPICYPTTVNTWLAMFLPSLAFTDINKEVSLFWKNNAVIIAILIIFLLLVIRTLYRRYFIVAIFIFAFVGMALEMLLLLQYQAKKGALFEDMGILLMAFMGGLAVGSFCMDKAKESLNKNFSQKNIGILLFVLFILDTLYTFTIFASIITSNLTTIGSALFVCGGLVATAFIYGVSAQNNNNSKYVATVYTIDLLGGCFGAIITTLMLIPFAGMILSIYVLIALLLCTLIFIL
ncbi:MAG: hypothetical protein WCJ49_07390, partial [Deltaproteobacteria bacterium]